MGGRDEAGRCVARAFLSLSRALSPVLFAGDGRWIVKDREDGQNCNNWHWTTKNISSHVNETLSAALQAAGVFPSDGLLAGCKIKSAETTGEASVNNRKGRTFLIYELVMNLKWEGEVVDADGKKLETAKGSMKLPDISAECLDDLEVEFETKQRGSALSEAMRKQGTRCVKDAIQKTIQGLQEEVTANAAKEKPAAQSLPAGVTPSRAPPQPIKIANPPPGPAAGTAAPVDVSDSARAPAKAAKPAAPKAAASSAAESDDDEDAPPAGMKAALAKLRANPADCKRLRLSNLGIHDVHLRPLIEALAHSQVSLEELDLSFNRLTDAGVHMLLRSFQTGTALELSKLFLGGNKVSVAGMALSQPLKQARPDLLVNWMLQLPNGKSMCSVGTVYAGSPADRAGLLQGDSLIAFGHVQHEEYKGVSESIVPVVKANVGKHIDVVVVRIASESGQVQQVSLSLTPQKWSGAGLLGCILK